MSERKFFGGKGQGVPVPCPCPAPADPPEAELEFVDVAFCEGRKTRVTGEKPSEQGKNVRQIQVTFGIAALCSPRLGLIF